METKLPKTRQELAMEMGICTKTLSRWFKKNNIKVPNGLIPPLKQQEIRQQLGFDNKY